nr:MAG TPA: hypothetical protein [Caudoviricetes sp.]
MAVRRPGWEARTSGSVGSGQDVSQRTHKDSAVPPDGPVCCHCGLVSRSSTSITLTVALNPLKSSDRSAAPSSLGGSVRLHRLPALSVSQL